MRFWAWIISWKKIKENYLSSVQISAVSSPLFISFCFYPDSCHSLHTMDQDYYEGTDYLSPVPADGERTEEFEYEVGTEIWHESQKVLFFFSLFKVQRNFYKQLLEKNVILLEVSYTLQSSEPQWSLLDFWWQPNTR